MDVRQGPLPASQRGNTKPMSLFYSRGDRVVLSVDAWIRGRWPMLRAEAKGLTRTRLIGTVARTPRSLNVPVRWDGWKVVEYYDTHDLSLLQSANAGESQPTNEIRKERQQHRKGTPASL